MAAGETSNFTIQKSTDSQPGPRLGRLCLPGRKAIDTPHYIAISSRGAVPHLSQDTFARQTHINGIYVALEDFIEKAPQQIPPVYNYASKYSTSPLRCFAGLPEGNVLVLGARRVPPIPCPTSSTPTAIPILTSVGFGRLNVAEYGEVVKRLHPDIVVALADLPHGADKVSRKRKDKITDRSARWMQEQVNALGETVDEQSKGSKPALFAPILPLEVEAQRWYIDQLAGEMRSKLDGLAIYSDHCLFDLPTSLQDFPKLSFMEPGSPHKLLLDVSHGVDLLTIPYIGAATDAGIALDFSFPVGAETADKANDLIPLGIDMWQTSHAADISPLRSGCRCYACSNHHRAYLQHLLMAKEMLGWVLLQIHNHHVMDEFFAGVRESIGKGVFEQDRAAFGKVHEPELPAKTGQGPRVRGYQFKSGGPNEVKRNPAAYRTLDDGKDKLANSAMPKPDADADELEAQGFAEKL